MGDYTLPPPPTHPHLFTKALIPYKDQKQMLVNVKNQVYPPTTPNSNSSILAYY